MIRPLGFELDDKRLRRAGLDYHEWANVRAHNNFTEFLKDTPHRRLWAITTRGKTVYTGADFDSDDILLVGPETRGLPQDLLDSIPADQHLRIPMLATSRSMNLSNAVSVVVYEAWRQQGFAAGV
jgi:tRNA (cytidine/uridine-2'-O-)-methyltransferase